jgi:putative transport protein
MAYGFPACIPLSLAAAASQRSPQAFAWLWDLFNQDSVARAVLVFGLVAAIGLGIGTIRIAKVGLGVAGVLFAGLAFGQAGFTINREVMDFAREFGLILFVYTIGVQVGPGFIASLRRNGMPLNLMAAGIVLLGVAVTLLLYFTLMDRTQLPVAVGLFSGASTNTPSLAAARQAISQALE